MVVVREGVVAREGGNGGGGEVGWPGGKGMVVIRESVVALCRSEYARA